MGECCALRLAIAPVVWEFSLGVCWRVLLWSPEMHRGSEKHGGEACMCAVLGGQSVSVPGCQRNMQRMCLLLHSSDNGSAA